MPTSLDRRMMQRAIDLAMGGQGRVEPNPMVGCVVVRGGRVIGEGFHRRFGGAHAEINALRSCSTSPRGATVYVSLEPCCHHGKTPPCVDAVVEAGVRRVVAALRDPNPSVRGRGLRRLRQAGIRVTVGVESAAAAELIAPFSTRIRLHRPYVIAKWAQSLDGRLTTPAGVSPWISCAASQRRVHRLRARVDAVVVGVGTVLADDPRLTPRGVAVHREAARVVLDGRLRTPEDARLIRSARRIPTLIITSKRASTSAKAVRMRRRGVEIIPCASRKNRIALDVCLSILVERGMTNVLVEGGATLLAAMLRANLVDEAYVFVAPKLMGGGAEVRSPSLTQICAKLNPREVRSEPSGVDVLYQIRLTSLPK